MGVFLLRFDAGRYLTIVTANSGPGVEFDLLAPILRGRSRWDLRLTLELEPPSDRC
jgi:hypothetical protein